MNIIAPSLLASDFSRLHEELEKISKSKATWLHLDIMDGVFVPNISFGMPILQSIKHFQDTFLFDVHLMIIQPEKYFKTFKELGTKMLTVHYEACTHLHRSIQEIKELGMQAGIALNPHTPVELLGDILEEVDLVCLMSVNPGFGGQKFIKNTLEKTKKLRKMIDEKGLKTLIEIDGGVSLQNAKSIKEAGANVLVAGSCVFGSENPVKTIEELYNV
jgi:ribulose-phosphate 3-epimerase